MNNNLWIADFELAQQNANTIVTVTDDSYSANSFWVVGGNETPINSYMLQDKDAYEMYASLKYNNPVVLEVAYDILKELRKQGKNNITISKTGDDELLIYRTINGEYRNLIIDEECDIAFMCIPNDRRNSYNEFYPFALVDANTLASKL